MAALSTYSGTTEFTEGIPTEDIGDFVMGYPYASRTFEAVSWAKRGKGTIVNRYLRWNSLSVPAGNKSESDQYTDVNLDLAESSITPGHVGFRLPISDEGDMNWDVGEVKPQALAECIEALADRMDSDGLSSSTSATNTVGAATDNFTVQKFLAAVASYRSTLSGVPRPMGTAGMFHHDAIRDLEASIGTTAAGFTINEASSRLFGSTDGYKGEFHGVQMFESGNMPAESGGWSNGLTPIGNRYSGLGAVLTQLPKIVPTRGDDAESRKVTYFVVDAIYGTGLTNPDRYVEVLSRT